MIKKYRESPIELCLVFQEVHQGTIVIIRLSGDAGIAQWAETTSVLMFDLALSLGKIGLREQLKDKIGSAHSRKTCAVN